MSQGKWPRGHLPCGCASPSWPLVGGQVSPNLGLKGRVPTEQANARVKAAFCTLLFGFQGLGFCFVSALWKCLLTMESARPLPRWARNPCADGGHLCPQKAGWGSLRGSRGTDITAHLPGARSSALSVAQPLL